jgi:hypothetical protein
MPSEGKTVFWQAVDHSRQAAMGDPEVLRLTAESADGI